MTDFNCFGEIALIIAFISFLGFTLENIWLIFRKGYADNRNMSLPFLLGYGVLVMGMYFLFGTPSDMRILGYRLNSSEEKERFLLYMGLAFLIVSGGEILLGFFTEKFFGVEYWNYSQLPLHITKYTSIPTSIGFALIITLFMDKCFPILMQSVGSLPSAALHIGGFVISVLLPLDFIVSFGRMHSSQKLNEKWRIRVFPKGILEMHKDRIALIHHMK